MFSILPDLTPRDSHSLWYTSSRNPSVSGYPFDHGLSGDNPNSILFNAGITAATNPTANPAITNTADNNNNHPSRQGQGHGSSSANNRLLTPAQLAVNAVERSPLGRLRADEVLAERRRAAVANLGCGWLKPPGVGKTLLQLREERREAEEHAEALRRERVAQELAEAEAQAALAAAQAGVAGADGGGGGGVGGEGDMVMMEEEGDLDLDLDVDEGDDGMGGRDLDEDIPDADEGGFGYDGASDEDEEEDEEEEEHEDGQTEEGEHNDASYLAAHRRRRLQQQHELADRMANIRATEERMRQRLARGGQQGGATSGGDFYGADEDIDEEDQAHILDEDDLVGEGHRQDEVEPGSDMDMEANLDDEIPEAEASGGYEHTDSEASLSSDGDGGHNLSYRRSSQILHHRNSLRRSGGPRSSLDISGFLSRDGSSFMGSSPHVGRRTQ